MSLSTTPPHFLNICTVWVFICQAAALLEQTPHKVTLVVIPGGLQSRCVSASTVGFYLCFPKCRIRGLSKQRGTYQPATSVFEETFLETTTRSKIHSLVKFSGKLASRSINSGSWWMSFFFIKRGKKKKKRAPLDAKVAFFIFPMRLNLSTTWSILLFYLLPLRHN